MTDEEARTSAAVLSVSSGGFRPELWRRRPFRAPHHTASGVALVGGGSHPRPGEISLAHAGVLFLDELPEFERHVLEVLREPLETGSIVISRAALQAEFPARFQLVAAMNPCPCGYLGDPGGRCHCAPDRIERYRARISGPLLDRVDLQIEVPALPPGEILERREPSEPSTEVRRRVATARERQLHRQGKPNGELRGPDIDAHCGVTDPIDALLRRAAHRFGLSARALHGVLRVARTIADLEGDPALAPPHVHEALALRRLRAG